MVTAGSPCETDFFTSSTWGLHLAARSNSMLIWVKHPICLFWKRVTARQSSYLDVEHLQSLLSAFTQWLLPLKASDLLIWLLRQDSTEKAFARAFQNPSLPWWCSNEVHPSRRFVAAFCQEYHRQYRAEDQAQLRPNYQTGYFWFAVSNSGRKRIQFLNQHLRLLFQSLDVLDTQAIQPINKGRFTSTLGCCWKGLA